MYAVAIGETFGAISFWGPFGSFEAAEYWAAHNASFSWWIVNLLNPQEV